MPETNTVLLIHESDNVVVATSPLQSGTIVTTSIGNVVAREDIAPGHKIAIRAISAGQAVTKYGFPIGSATVDIAPGSLVHAHNTRTRLAGKVEYTYQAKLSTDERRQPIHSFADATFDGYVRADGEVGIRNEIWIINTVGCINKVAERIAATAHRQYAGDGVDGIYHFPHPYGCSQLGDDLVYTQKCLSALARHPNAAGVLILGLGCENNRLESFLPFVGDHAAARVRFMSVQSVDDEMEEALRHIDALVSHARAYQRQAVPLARLKIGLKCGGSDGFSGITANPVVGRVSDLLVAAGGTALLTEVPEMFGAETILMERAKDAATFEAIVGLIDGFKDYYTRHNQVIYENPSPGNKDGGITTLEEKSLGCIQKGGSSAVCGVIEYGDVAKQPGLQLVQAPGNDMVSVTALAAAGAHMMLFTTGRGTPLGGPVPTLKISTNTDLATRKPRWIDFDAGTVLAGRSLEAVAEDLFSLVLEVASGRRQTCNEQNDYREIAIFKDGVTL